MKLVTSTRPCRQDRVRLDLRNFLPTTFRATSIICRGVQGGWSWFAAVTSFSTAFRLHSQALFVYRLTPCSCRSLLQPDDRRYGDVHRGLETGSQKCDSKSIVINSCSRPQEHFRDRHTVASYEKPKRVDGLVTLGQGTVVLNFRNAPRKLQLPCHCRSSGRS